jgi:hypothetical protein
MLETEEMSERDLPPEIVRRLQVEELWARRLVLAELMNVERLRLYNRRRAEVWPASFASTEFTWKELPARPAASIVPIKAKKSLATGT